jgi:hypothetical protein
VENNGRHRRFIPVMIIITIGLLIISALSIDPWVFILAGILVLVLIREALNPNGPNTPLISSLAFATIIALVVALLFSFYMEDIGYRLKEITIAVSCLTMGFLVILSMVSHTRLEMNTAFAVLSTLFMALFMVTLLILNLLLFDTLAGNTLIIDNRWMMFIITDISFLVLGLWVVMVFLKRSIPFKGNSEGSM